MSSDSQLEASRQRMIDEHLRGRGIRSPQVLAAMARVARERFAPCELASEAYADRALSIDCGQTISQPYIVALMSEALELLGKEHVLEIGTGSGYQAAILAELAGDVISLERHQELSRRAGEVLDQLGYKNVQLVVADGTLGWPTGAPYDRVIVTAAAQQCPPALFEQLCEGGILVAPIGPGSGQTLQAIRKIGGQPQTARLTSCRFVPLIGSQGEPL